MHWTLQKQIVYLYSAKTKVPKMSHEDCNVLIMVNSGNEIFGKNKNTLFELQQNSKIFINKNSWKFSQKTAFSSKV